MLPLAHDQFYDSKECLLIALLGYFGPGFERGEIVGGQSTF
jgi:hypothetical protein